MKYKGTKKDTADKKTNKDKKVKRKRKAHISISNKPKTSKKNKEEKIKESENNKTNKNIEEVEKRYCIENCKFGNKSKGMPMIQCDRCFNWFHCKCIDSAVKDFIIYNSMKKTWYCPNCQK